MDNRLEELEQSVLRRNGWIQLHDGAWVSPPLNAKTAIDIQEQLSFRNSQEEYQEKETIGIRLSEWAVRQ